MTEDHRDDGRPTTAQKEKLLEVHRRLCGEYGCPVAYFHTLDPLSELISSLLSHRTKNKDSGTAFKELKKRFPTWEAVRDAPTADLQAAITAVTWPEQKAPRIQAILRRITELKGEALTLSFLQDMPVAIAREWLEALPGVGPKTSAAVLSFSTLRRRALPVDSHHHRVAVRLRVIPQTTDVGPSHDLLEAMLPTEWDAQAVYDHHEVMMFHGQRVCFHSRPDCPHCVLLDLCPEGQKRMARLDREQPPGREAS
jgi:endonuclease III